MKRVLILMLALGAISVQTSAERQASAKHPYASDRPLNEAAIFAEGVISTRDNESGGVFAPDGRTLYFVKSTPDLSLRTILFSRFDGTGWGTPEVAPFSGRFSDADPFITPDGRKFFFISARPVEGKSDRDLDIWGMEKTAAGWGEPRNLGAPVNSPGDEWFPTVTTDGTLYFGSSREGGQGQVDIYRSKLVEGKYGAPENLGESINSQSGEFEPLIAPDESFLIFAAAGRPDGLGAFDLFISYNRNGAWTKAENLGPKINSSAWDFAPKISPDGRYLFFASSRGFGLAPQEKRFAYQELVEKLRSPRNGLRDIYQVDLGALDIKK